MRLDYRPPKLKNSPQNWDTRKLCPNPADEHLHMNSRSKSFSWIASCCILLAGCGTGFIEGTVLDVTGQTLPGVAVEVRGTPYEGLSDAHGRYSVKYQPGELQLYFAKTGYTPGMLVLTVNSMRNVEATSVVLWRLPEGGGVYLYEDHRYRRTDFIPPSPFKSMSAEGGVVYGTTRWPKLETTDRDPLILCHKMPPYGCKLYQMNLAELHPPSDDTGNTTVSAWIPGENIPIVTEPIDAPEGLLVRIRPMRPLETGSYAAHWGALDGVPVDNEQRMFFFNIVDTITPQAGEDETPAESSPETESVSPTEDENDA
jgi:hypothetical protein